MTYFTKIPFLALTLSGLVFIGNCDSGNSSDSDESTEGTYSTATEAAGTIVTIAGSGHRATDPVDSNSDQIADDPIAWNEASFDLPMDMTIGPDGRIYILDWNGHKIRALDQTARTVAFIVGTGVEGDACEIAINADGSCPALYAEMNHMTDVVFDPQGRMIVAAWHNAKIKRVDLTLQTSQDLCGSGKRNFTGDGGPCANETSDELVDLDLPSSVVFDKKGNLFITDQANQVIRRVSAEGIIKVVAGNCPGTQGFGCFTGQGYSGDGGPATSAKLKNNLGQSTDPQGKITMDAEGNLYIADSGNHVVRKVTPGSDGIIGDGDPAEEIISTVAGTGTPGYSGDHGKATEATLNGPRDVRVAPDGTLFIADTFNQCVRKVDTAGIISTVAGQCGASGDFTGDDGPAVEATLNGPYGIELDEDGHLYIADSLNYRVRMVYGVYQKQ